MASWPYINKFGNWPVGAHVIRFAIGVDKHKPCMLYIASFVNGVQCKGTDTVFSNSYKRRPRIPGSVASSIYIIWPSRPCLWSLQGAYIAIRYSKLSAPTVSTFLDNTRCGTPIVSLASRPAVKLLDTAKLSEQALTL